MPNIDPSQLITAEDKARALIPDPVISFAYSSLMPDCLIPLKDGVPAKTNAP